ncbi:MAG: tyrosine-type recombinase/integrase, partial [Planctomycetota bacterium]
MRLFKAGYKDRKGVNRKSAKWYVEFRDHLMTVRRIPAFTDKKASEELGRKLEKLVASRLAGEAPDIAMTRWLEAVSTKLREKLCEIGLLDASRAAAGKLLTEHVSDWEKHLETKGCTEKHSKLSRARVESVFAGCKMRTWTDISAGTIQYWLAEQRSKGLSYQTSNHYRQHLQAFCNWMVREGRASQNPLKHLQGLNVKVDRRHDRRALTANEIQRLLTAAENGETFRCMSGQDRALLYRLALETGLRASELASLAKNSFSLETNPPTVTVKAAYSKHRRDDTLPLRPETAQIIKEFVKGNFASAPLFSKIPDTAKM